MYPVERHQNDAMELEIKFRRFYVKIHMNVMLELK